MNLPVYDDTMIGHNFTPQDLENELQDRLDIKVIILCPKAHEERGRVERRIRLIREMLKRTGKTQSSP